VHVVYVVGPTDPGDQLRYSLRSLSTNLRVSSFDVTVAGFVPRWLRDIQALPVPQSGSKQENIRAAIRAACERYDEWLLCWDDVFVCQPIDHLPRMHRGPMRDLVDAHRSAKPLSSYLRDLEATGKALEAEGIPVPLAYDCIHVPQPIHSPTMLRALDLAGQHSVSGVLTVHGNLRSGDRGMQVGNAKATSGWSRRAFVSTNDRRWRAEPVGGWLRDLFPEPSPWEK